MNQKGVSFSTSVAMRFAIWKVVSWVMSGAADGCAAFAVRGSMVVAHRVGGLVS